jgi:hypothetical protein
MTLVQRNAFNADLSGLRTTFKRLITTIQQRA